MKTTDFIKENFVADAAEAHQDHEVQMARSDCYNAAKYAIELHKLLKNISEQQGLDGWVSEKITLANDYLRTVTEYLRYEQQSGSQSDMPEFNIGTATQTLDSVLGESSPSKLQEGAFTWYLKAHGRLLSPLTSDEPYKFNSKEEAIAFAKQKYKTNWQNIVPTTYDVPNSLADQPDSGWNEKNLKPVQEDDIEEARKPMVNFDAEDIKKLEKIRDLETLKTQAYMLISRPSERPMKPEKVAWFKGTLENMNSPLKVIKLMYDLLLSGEGHSVIGSKSSMNPNSYRARFNEQDDEEPETKRKPAVIKTNKPVGSRVADIGPGGKEYNVKTDKAWDDQHKEVDEAKADPTGSWVVYNDTTVKRFKTRDGAKAYAEKNGGKVASSEFYADNVQKQGVDEDMSRAAKGNEKYGKDGMKALAKAGREGASEKTLDTIRDKYDNYDEDLSEEAKKGLYYYVNKRKEAGTSRPAGHPKAPTPQAWKDAAKTAKKESVAETTSSGSVATSMGGGNGFVNGGPGTIARPKMKKKK